MKQLSLTILSVFVFLFARGQEDSTASFFLKYVYDSVAQKHVFQASRPLLCTSDGSTGFLLEPLFNRRSDGLIEYRQLECLIAGVGECNQRNRLIFLFVHGGPVTLTSRASFNCKGNAYFELGRKEILRLARPLKQIRFVSGRHYRSYTYVVPGRDRFYFQEVLAALSRKPVPADPMASRR